MTRARRYLLCPGPVISRVDRDWHYIGARQLAALYGVRMDECLILPEYFVNPVEWGRLQAGVERGELIELRPNGKGNYRLPATGAQA